ncbi:Golgi resident protein GCP60 [Lepeophtheirus salmonis]|uniref:Golgi resident protein GCP60 n=1 Tax=Lepeophtheirus salmonis TaxID=72036 RepID=UPI001AE58BF1|nr:Golgi resident protein GCP60-like [Lepeophtheirus salmonis]
MSMSCVEDPSLCAIYREALRFFKADEGRRRLECSYEDQVRLVAYTQQVVHGSFSPEKVSPLGTLDVIGKDRRNAWKKLSGMKKEEAMKKFSDSILELFPEFKTLISELIDKQKNETSTTNENEEKEELKAEEAEKKAHEEAQQCRERQLQEDQRRQIQDALNKQTFSQFKAFAEQQYPNNPDQQAILIKRLQVQYYYQYMQQVYQNHNQMENSSQTTTTIAEQINVTPNKLCDMVSNLNITPADGKGEEVGVQVESEVYFQEEGAIDDRDDSDNFDEDEEDDEDHVCSDECGFCSCEEFLPANMWTKKDIDLFKDSIRMSGGDSIIKVGQGETATVRVPTRDDGGSALFWEFATDSYDIAFGLFFEWSKSEDEQHVTVHVSDSEDEDLNDDESFNECDPERASAAALLDKRPQMSIIVPIYRRDCHEEVYAGSHTYPGQGVYLLKFDNTFSLWRSKTLYYRVYYTQ